MSIPWFLLGILTGIVCSSLMWILYISFFPEDTLAMRERIREWLRGVLHLPPTVQ